MLLFRRMSEESQGGGVHHFDFDAYKRGGDQWRPLPPDAPRSITDREREAVGEELLQTQMLKLMLHASKRSEQHAHARSRSLPGTGRGCKLATAVVC